MHLTFDFDRKNYGLKDIVTGFVTFLKVGIRINIMELQLIKRETIGTGENQKVDNTVLGKYELMDGGPIKSLFLKRRNSSNKILPCAL